MPITEPLWWLSREGDKTLLKLYERHYSCYRYRDGRKRSQFVGPGEKVVQRTAAGDAMWVWRKFIDTSAQTPDDIFPGADGPILMPSQPLRLLDRSLVCYVAMKPVSASGVASAPR